MVTLYECTAASPAVYLFIFSKMVVPRNF